jgi:phosphate:Na+ symporter
MSATLTLLDLAGDVGLLLWGTHMVTTGVLRGYGTNFRRRLGRSLDRRLNAFMVGLAVTAILQSSTATGLMAASFAASGMIDLAPGLAAMLGANVGTTLIVQVLSFNVAILAPILILVGVAMFRHASGDTQFEELGRASIGLGLMLLALNLLVHSVASVESAPLLPTIVQSLVGQPFLAMLIAALLTWACHSRVAVVLLIVPLVTSGVVPLVPSPALVLGANLGGSLPAWFEAGSP